MGQRLLKADFLFKGNGEVIREGMLRLEDSGKILEVGNQLPGENSEIEVLKGGLCPAFINAHCHLELSHLRYKIPKHQGIHGFIPALQHQREGKIERLKQLIEDADSEMKAAGIKAVGDICNGAESIECKQNSSIHYHSFIELFGLHPGRAQKIIEEAKSLRSKFLDSGLTAGISPHSPYSVSNELLQLIVELNQSPFSIHHQESEAENQLFNSRSGPLKAMLTAFGIEESHIDREQRSTVSHILHFFDKDQSLQLVHNTFSKAEDIQFAEANHKQLYWCFCPKANWYIEKALPNFSIFIENEVKCTLGTDSLASNEYLSILEEIKLIRKHFPQIRTEKLISWACENGAEFLNLSELGIFEEGRSPGINQLTALDKEGQIGPETGVKVIL